VRAVANADGETLKMFLKEKVVSPEAVQTWMEEVICGEYCWTLDYVRSMSNKDFTIYFNLALVRKKRKKEW